MGNPKKFTAISFCTGYGGLEEGVRRVCPNLRVIAACEIEMYAVANLCQKMETGALEPFPIWTDLKTFDGRPFRNKVDILMSGYPCQPWSNAGKRLGKDDPRHLWPYILEHIRTIRPVWCFFENVGGHLSLGFDEVFKSLRYLGYSVEAGLFTAAEVGAPHKRERLFILAYGQQFGQLQCKLAPRHWQGVSSCGGAGQKELANSDIRPSRPATIAESTRPAQPESGDDSGKRAELAKPNSLGKQRVVGSIPDTQERQEQSGQIGLCNGMWPARPGQPQYDWEELRTVESGMGRTTHGTCKKLDPTTFRVDRLRLLGNGVVAQTAKLAWEILWQKINTNREK